MRKIPLFLCLIACALAACAPAAIGANPSATPSPPATETIGVPGASPTPSASSTPSAAPTLAPPDQGVDILAPGSGTALQSPITFHALLQSGIARAHIELVDANRALLYRRVMIAPDVELLQRIDFNVRADSQARLTILLFDAYGRNTFASSVSLELLIDGVLQEAEDGAGEIQIESPAEGAEFAGGQITVSGRVRGQSGRPLVVQILTQAGRVLVSQEVYPGEFGPDGYQAFSLDLAVSVNEDTPVLITVSQSGGLVPGLWLLNSVEVVLLDE